MTARLFVKQTEASFSIMQNAPLLKRQKSSGNCKTLAKVHPPTEMDDVFDSKIVADRCILAVLAIFGHVFTKFYC